MYLDVDVVLNNVGLDGSKLICSVDFVKWDCNNTHMVVKVIGVLFALFTATHTANV